MLDQHDLQQIGSIVDTSINRAIETLVKPMINGAINGAINSLVVDVLKPSFDEVYLRLDRVEQRLDDHDKRLENLETNMVRMNSLMVTKPYLDDKLADMDGRWNRRFDSLICILHEKEVLNTRDLRKIRHAAL